MLEFSRRSTASGRADRAHPVPFARISNRQTIRVESKLSSTKQSSLKIPNRQNPAGLLAPLLTPSITTVILPFWGRNHARLS